MTKKDLITAVCNANPNIAKSTNEQAVNLLFEMMTLYLTHHQRIELRGFGVFSVRTRQAHRAHNPQTGETILVPTKSVPFFKPSQSLKEDLKKAVSKGAAEMQKKSGFFSFLYRSNSPAS